MKLKLHPHQRNDPLWMKLKAEIERELDVLRRKNDAMAPEEATAHLRGRIAALKDLLAIEDVKAAE